MHMDFFILVFKLDHVNLLGPGENVGQVMKQSKKKRNERIPRLVRF